jgi:hypothetical protein
VTAEPGYAFRQRLDQVHRPNRRDHEAVAAVGEVSIGAGWSIAIPLDASDYLAGVAQDLQEYLFTSMGVSVLLVRRPIEETAAKVIRLTTQEHGTEGLCVARSYRLQITSEQITICGYDERGIGQGCYYLEDLMNLRQGPFLDSGEQTRAPVFSPRMVHSGWGIDQFPDAHLNAIVHAGFDAVLVFVKGVNRTTTGFMDINDLILRAARFGLDVYLYSYIISEKHPDDADAESFYESTYGELMRAHAGARGIVFVGESCEFPSHDTHTTQKLRSERTAEDDKPNPGWWPCTDYPEWLNLVKRVIRRYNPDADVVFWTYNWGWAPPEDRLALIESLPQDISLQATFEMFENVERRGTPTRCVDYTISFAGPGQYFASEAAAAHERGLPLYTMSNTGGRTWDFGVVPYEPVPYQWAQRHEALLKAHQEWGLCGLMESHHMGWWPSVVSDLAKWAFWQPGISAEALLPQLACRDFGAAASEQVLLAWQHWSEAIVDYVPTNEDQYGPFRVGPAYPLSFTEDEIEFPSADYAHFGSRILKTAYRPHDPTVLDGEIACLEAMASRWDQGVMAMRHAAAAATESKREDARRALGLGEFIGHCVRTTIHVKLWWQLRQELQTASAQEPVLARMIELAHAEIDNTVAAIPLVEDDSRLGWEPSMEYMADRAHLEWKIAQVQRVLQEEIPTWREQHL